MKIKLLLKRSLKFGTPVGVALGIVSGVRANTVERKGLFPVDSGQYEVVVKNVPPSELTLQENCGIWCLAIFDINRTKLVWRFLLRRIANFDRLNVALLYAKHNGLRVDLYRKVGTDDKFILKTSGPGIDLLGASTLTLEKINPLALDSRRRLNGQNLPLGSGDVRAFQLETVKFQAEQTLKSIRLLIDTKTLTPWYEVGV